MGGIGRETLIFLYALLAGMSVLFVYYILICLRRVIRHCAAAADAEDMAFWLWAAGFIFGQMYDATYGSVRGYFLFGIAAGAAVGYALIRFGAKISVKFQKTLEKCRKNR